MNIFNKSSLTLGAILMGCGAFAQNPTVSDPAQTGNASTYIVKEDWKPSLVKDGVIDKVPHVNRSLDMNNIREIDVAWAKRVWREIDVRQKQNQAFIYEGDEFTGGGAFIEILIDAVRKGKVAAYSPLDDRFTAPLDMEGFEKNVSGSEDSSKVVDPITLEETWVKTRQEFDVRSVTKYQIKEDWIFDRNVGRLQRRIVAIAPLLDRIDENGVFRGSIALFWLNYPELRKQVLPNYEVYNPENIVNRMTWADYFDGGYFASYVIKSSDKNPANSRFSRDLRGLEDGERVIEALRAKEDDMWQR